MTAMSETPRTDARRVTFAEAQVWDDPAGDYVDADFACGLERELNDLTRWKAEALEVDASWDPQAIGKLLGMTLGTPIHQNIQPAIEKLLAQLAAERALADRLAEVLRLYDADTLAGETMQWVPEHDKALAAWEEARRE